MSKMSRQHSVTKITASSRFYKQGEADKPLERCRNWVRDNCIQSKRHMPMMVVAFETEAGGREFMAGTHDSIWNVTRQAGAESDGERRMHEVVLCGPCRLYCDFEVEFAAGELRSGAAEMRRRSLHESALRFIDALAEQAQSKYGVSLTPFIMHSPKETKWSLHVVFDGAVWRDSAHCRAFVFAVAAALKPVDALIEKYVDLGVYDRNHSLRMYRSTKLDEPERSVVALDGANPSHEPIDRALWLRSLITLFPFRAGPHTMATTGYLMRHYDELVLQYPEAIDKLLEHEGAAGHSAAKKTTATAKMGDKDSFIRISLGADDSAAASAANEQLIAALREARPLLLQSLAAYHPDSNGVNLSLEYNNISMAVSSRYCEILGAEHRHKHVFLIVDFLRGAYRQACWDVDCRRMERPKWNQFSAEDNDPGYEACRLLREAWAPAKPVGEFSRWFAKSSLVTGTTSTT